MIGAFESGLYPFCQRTNRSVSIWKEDKYQELYHGKQILQGHIQQRQHQDWSVEIAVILEVARSESSANPIETQPVQLPSPINALSSTGTAIQSPDRLDLQDVYHVTDLSYYTHAHVTIIRYYSGQFFSIGYCNCTLLILL